MDKVIYNSSAFATRMPKMFVCNEQNAIPIKSDSQYFRHFKNFTIHTLQTHSYCILVANDDELSVSKIFLPGRYCVPVKIKSVFLIRQ